MATSHAHLASTPILQPKLQTCGFPSGATDGASRPSCCDVPRAVRPTNGLNAPNAWVTGVANLPRFNRCTYTTGRLYLNILTGLESELHDHTPISPRTVAHPSTNQGRCCLTSVIERELVFQHRHRAVDPTQSTPRRSDRQKLNKGKVVQHHGFKKISDLCFEVRVKGAEREVREQRAEPRKKDKCRLLLGERA